MTRPSGPRAGRRGPGLVLVLVLALALAVAAAGCGVRTDEAPRAIARDEVPFDLLAPNTTSTTPADPVGQPSAPVFLVANDEPPRLAPVRRQVGAPGSVQAVLKALLEPTTDEEADDGLRNLIPEGTGLLGVALAADRLVTVNLSEEFFAVRGEAQRLAVAQVVFTATGVAGIEEVLFEFDGEAREVIDGSGELRASPLVRSDFAQYAPDRPAPDTGSN